ncbi:MAG: hypothetical protein AB8I08_27050 [Sandaracinaceae bacterium]
MGWERIALASMALAWFQFCGAEEESAASELPAIEGTVQVAVSPAAAAEVVAPAPSEGGTVVVVGPHPLEIAPYGDGTVVAHVRSDAPPPPATTQLTVRVPADDGESHPVLLVWDPAEGHYRGRLRRVHPAPGPVEVTMVVDGTRYAGRQPEVVIVAPTAPPPVVVEVEAPPEGGAVEVEDPRVQVEVNGPRPPAPHVRVEVDAPRPPRASVVVDRPAARPSVRVGRRGRGRARARRRRRGRRTRVRIRH